MASKTPTNYSTPADKYLKDAKGKTIYGPNNAPIKNPSYDPKVADAQQAKLASLYNEPQQLSQPKQPTQQQPESTTIQKGESLSTLAKKYGTTVNALMAANPNITDPNKISTGMQLNIPGMLPQQPAPQQSQQPVPEQKSIMDTISGALSGAAKSTSDFLTDYRGLVGAGVSGVAAYQGYQAGKEAREGAQKVLAEQLAQTQASDKALQAIKYDPARYAQEQQFRQQRIAGGGITPEEQQMQREGDVRAAKMAAAARLSGLEQQARTTGGLGGAGAALAASLAGAQGLAGTQAQANLAREVSASQRLEQDIVRAGALKTLGTQEEANLAQIQAQQALEKSKAAGTTRADISNQLLSGGEAQTKLYKELADLAMKGIKIAPTQLQKAQEDAALADAKAREAAANQQLQAKAGAAQQMGSAPTTTVVPPQSKPANQPIAQAFNQANQAISNVKTQAQQVAAKPVQQVQQAVAKPVQQVQQAVAKPVQQVAQQAKKAVSSVVPASLKNIFSF